MRANKTDSQGNTLETGDTVKVSAYGQERIGYVMSFQYKTIDVIKVKFANGDWASYFPSQVTLVKKFAMPS